MDPGQSQMQDLLYNDATIQSLVSSYTKDAGTKYLIFAGSLLPDHIETDSGQSEIDVKKKTINHFQIDTEGGGITVIDLNRQISCRAYTETDARAIRDRAFTVLNRVKSSDGSVSFIASKLPVIFPNDKTDNWNAPLNVRTMTTR